MSKMNVKAEPQRTLLLLAAPPSPWLNLCFHKTAKGRRFCGTGERQSTPTSPSKLIWDSQGPTDPEELMGWAAASPSVPIPAAREGGSHRREVSATSPCQRRNPVDFQPKIIEIK